MKKGKIYVTAMMAFLWAIAAFWGMDNVAAFTHEDIRKYPSCPLCGMDRQQYGHSRMLIKYAEGKATGTCSIHCTASEISVNRDKTVVSMLVGDYHTKKLIEAKKAFWVIGGGKPGVMTKRAKWAFYQKRDAEEFVKENGGRLGTFDEAMKATFVDMYEDIKMIRERKREKQSRMPDIKTFPECKYCGMIREKFASSRTLVEYEDGSAVGTCSVHCLAIDLALNPGKTPKIIMVGDYYSKNLIDAEKAFWVLGGEKMGVMSIRGKWAMDEKESADRFIKENGGQLVTFDRIIKASFEDMYEILR